MTPAKMAKESTPGDSDSWNRCNPSLAGAFDVKDGTPGRQRNDKAKLTMTTDNSRLINVRGNEKKNVFPIL